MLQNVYEVIHHLFMINIVYCIYICYANQRDDDDESMMGDGYDSR